MYSASSVNVDTRLRSIRQQSGCFLLRCQVQKPDNEVRKQVRIFIEGISPQKTTKTKKNEQRMQTYSVPSCHHEDITFSQSPNLLIYIYIGFGASHNE